MNYIVNNAIPASRAIEYMQLRLSSAKITSFETRRKTSTGTDRLIEHIRLRLTPPFQPQNREDCHRCCNA